MDITKKSPKALASLLERLFATRDTASSAVYALALHGGERWNDIATRLGEDHPAITDYRKADAAEEEAYAECGRRWGHTAVSHRSHWPTFLRVRA